MTVLQKEGEGRWMRHFGTQKRDQVVSDKVGKFFRIVCF